MPTIFGIPVLALIMPCLGTAFMLFMLIKYLMRPKGNKKDRYIITNVHIISGDGGEYYNQNVFIKNGLIAEISGSELKSKNALIIDGNGKTLMPGIIDCHTHIGGMNCKSSEDTDKLLAVDIGRVFSENILPYGITTVKDLDAPMHFVKKLQNEIKEGKITGPEMLIVGPNFTTPNGHPANTLGRDCEWLRNEIAITVTKPGDVTEGIRKLKELGVDFLKFTYQSGDYLYCGENVRIDKMDKALMQQIIREGRENGLKTTAHVFYEADVRELLEAGIYGIEHGILDRKLSSEDDIVKLWKESGARFVPTINAMTYEKGDERLENAIHNLKILYDAGIPIAMGTDSMLEIMPGDVQHKELQYYVEAGISPMQAIVLATKNAAEHLGISERKGTVAVGKEADLILLGSDPTQNIHNTRDIKTVFLKGKPVYSEKPIQTFELPDYSYPDDKTVILNVTVDGNTERALDVSQFVSDRKLIHTVKEKGKLLSTEEITVNECLSANEWHYSRPSDDTDIYAKRQSGNIHMTGKFKGKAQDKSFRIGEGLWYQLVDDSLSDFALSDLDEILLYSIGTGDNRGAMTLNEFAAKKAGEETITLNGKSYDCIKVSLVLTMFSWAWTGIYYYDKKTGILIQSGEKKGGSVKVSSTIQ